MRAQVKRTVKAKIGHDRLLVGDIIGFTLKDGEYVEAMAVAKGNSGTLFVTVDCLAKRYCMNSTDTNDGGWENSELRQKLNSEILDRFPDDIRNIMLPVEGDDLLTIPTEREIFGENEYGKPDYRAQWKPMKLRRNRMAFEGFNGDTQWYWLQNASKDYAASFAGVGSGGNAYANGASYARGVRPVFLLKSSI